MVSYAFKRGCTDIILIYPNISERVMPPDRFVISSGFNESEKINVTAMELPFWSLNNFEQLDTRLKETIAWNMNRI
jgi:5-methylcytosine-specific restriction enzyme subunit McrC